METFQATIQQMLNEDKRRDTFKFLSSLTGLKLNREQVSQTYNYADSYNIIYLGS